MLIGEAFRDCIHPHADAIYRSGADVPVSSIIRRRNQQALPDDDDDDDARSHAVQQGRSRRFRPGPDFAIPGLLAPAEVAGNRSKMD